MLVLAYPIGALIGFFLSKTPSLFQIIEKLPISPYNDINKFNKTGFIILCNDIFL